jgi:hypothetical protein
MRQLLGWLVALCLVGLAACEQPRPFQPTDKRNAPDVVRPPATGAGPAAADRPEIVIEAPVGMPADNAKKLATALTIELRRHDVVATTVATPGLPRLAGAASTSPLPSGIEIRMAWTLFDAKGHRVDTIENGTSGRDDDWQSGSDRMLSRFAARTAPDVAIRLGKPPAPEPPEQMSWSVLPGMPRGPDEPRPPGGVPVVPTLPPEGPPADQAARPGPDGARPAAAPVAMSRYPKVRVPVVTGAPGDGNATLTRSMRRSLGSSQMILVDHADPQAFTVAGTVTVSPVQDGRQRVSIKWVVSAPGGQRVGDLEQANAVPAGALNGPWGGLADVITIAATDAVVDLIRRARAAGAGAAR